MIRRIFGLLALLTGFSVLAAQDASYHQPSIEAFKSNYNADDYAAIYGMFAQDMKQALSLDNTKTFFANIKSAFGKLQSVEYVGEAEPFSKYKGTFEEGVLAVHLSWDREEKFNGINIVPFDEEPTGTLETNNTLYQWPLDAEWTVFWGGTTREQNYHIDSKAQQGALDLIITNDEGKSHVKSGKSNDNYFAWGQSIYAPVAGKVVMKVDGIPDNVPGVMNPMYAPGNAIMIETIDGDYLLIAHLQKGTVVVEEGQEIQTGDLIGICGNSGNSSEPHVHIHLQSTSDLVESVGKAMVFKNLLVNNSLIERYSPVKNDRIQRAQGQ